MHSIGEAFLYFFQSLLVGGSPTFKGEQKKKKAARFLQYLALVERVKHKSVVVWCATLGWVHNNDSEGKALW